MHIYILNKIAIVLLDFWAKVHAIKPGVMLLLANQKALIRVIEIYRFFVTGPNRVLVIYVPYWVWGSRGVVPVGSIYTTSTV